MRLKRQIHVGRSCRPSERRPAKDWSIPANTWDGSIAPLVQLEVRRCEPGLIQQVQYTSAEEQREQEPATVVV